MTATAATTTATAATTAATAAAAAVSFLMEEFYFCTSRWRKTITVACDNYDGTC